MDIGTLLLVIGCPAMFAVGVLCHKYVVSEAAALKDHVTAEVAEVRADLADALDKVKSKL